MAKKAKEDFVHFHTHSDFSALDGCGKVSNFVKRAKELGAPAIAFSEHGTQRGYYTQHTECKENGIKPIYGIEFYIANDMKRKGLTDEERDDITKGIKRGDRREVIKEYEERHGIRDRWHLTVWAKNNEGLRNLFKLSSAAYIEGFYYKPRIDLKTLMEHGEGLAVATGCLSSPINDRITMGQRKKALQEADALREHFGEDLWIEIQPHAIPEQVTANQFALELQERWGKHARLLATQDAHYVHQEDWEHHEVLLCIGTNDNLSNPDHFRFDGTEFYFKTRREMFETFRSNHAFMSKEQIKGALDNTLVLAEMCNAKVEIDYHKALLPGIEIPKGYRERATSLATDPQWEYLKGLCFEGWVWREIPKRAVKVAARLGVDPGEKLIEYKKRLSFELNALKNQNFLGYFLIVWDLYAFARERKIMCGPGRGSVAGSLAAFLLGLTSVDPLEHGLIFERFINPNRVDMPDCDMDFEDGRRHEIIQYIRDKYGAENVCQIATIGKLSGKQCIKDVSRVLEVPYAAVNEVTSSIIERSSGDERASQTIEDSFRDFKICRQFNKKYPKVLHHAKRLEGMAKNLGIHAAGVVAAPFPLAGYIPLEVRKHNNEDIVVSAIDMHGISAVGLVKLDVLGLRTLTVIRNCLDAIEERHGKVIDPESDFELNDPEVLQGFTDHDYTGIFQYDTPGADKICAGVKFESFEDVAAMTALNRPGTARSGLATQYVARKKDPKLRKEHTFHPLVTELTQDTLGIIVYQEHVIKIFTEIAGFAPGTADSLRKSIAKKYGDETIGKERENFIKGAMKKTGMTRKEAAKIMNAITFFGCLQEDTEIATPNGPKAISTLRPGDEIWSSGPEGTLVKNRVKAAGSSGIKQLYRLKTESGAEALASEEHFWLGKYGYQKTRYVGAILSYHVAGDENEKLSDQGRLSRVISVEPAGEDETWDLECENEPHNYILQNGLTSHNSYGFNKSHATAYGMIAFWGMWLKLRYPIEFFWALLKNEPQRLNIQNIAKDAKAHDIELLPPSVNASREHFAIDDAATAIRGSLVDIKGVGSAAATTIMENQPYEDFWDLMDRVERRKCHKGVMLALAKSGALDDLLPNVKWFVDSIEDFWALVGKKKLDDAKEMMAVSTSLDDYEPEEKQLIAAQVNPLAFGRHPIDAYEEFIAKHIKVPIVDMSSEDFFKDHDNKGVYIIGVILEVKYNQIGDFHTGEPPPEDEREKMFWGSRYANVNIEDPGGIQNRTKFDIDIFDDMRELIDSGNGTPVIAHVAPNEHYGTLKAHFAIDIEKLRKKINEGDPLSTWESIVTGAHPAKVYPWRPGKIPFKNGKKRVKIERSVDAIKNVRWRKHATTTFTGVVTHVRKKIDKRDQEMAFFGLLGGDNRYIDAICFGTVWPHVKKHLKAGRLVQISIDSQPDRYRGGKSFIFNGDELRLLKKSAKPKPARKART